MTPPPGCGSHAGLGAELRAVAVLAMDRIGPALDRVRSESGDGDPDGAGPGPGSNGVGAADARSSGAGRGADGGSGGTTRGPQSAETCAVCPVCAVIAVLRGERPELAVRLAEHAAGLLAVLQSALHEGDPHAGWPPPAGGAAHASSDAHPAPSRRVQHIRVDRPASAHPC